MLREGTWLVRHACSNTQIGAQNACLALTSRASTRLSSTAHRFCALGCPPGFSSLAENEEAVLDMIEGMHSSFGKSPSTASSCYAHWPYQRLADRYYPLRHEQHSPIHVLSNDSNGTPNSSVVGTQSSCVPSAQTVRLGDHRDHLSECC